MVYLYCKLFYFQFILYRYFLQFPILRKYIRIIYYYMHMKYLRLINLKNVISRYSYKNKNKLWKIAKLFCFFFY